MKKILNLKYAFSTLFKELNELPENSQDTWRTSITVWINPSPYWVLVSVANLNLGRAERPKGYGKYKKKVGDLMQEVCS